jgi:hypothetical protein
VFFQVGLRSVGAHGLAVLHGGQLADHERACSQADEQRRRRGEHRAERDEVEDPEYPDVLLKKLCEPEQHD